MAHEGLTSGELLPHVVPSADRPCRVIIDTDPGIDDMVALVLALRSPELQVRPFSPPTLRVDRDQSRARTPHARRSRDSPL